MRNGTLKFLHNSNYTYSALFFLQFITFWILDLRAADFKLPVNGWLTTKHPRKSELDLTRNCGERDSDTVAQL